jgi:hypothetical protein
MSWLVSLLFLFHSASTTLAGGSPLFLPIPTVVLNYVPWPEVDEQWSLTPQGRYADIRSKEADVKGLQRMDDEWPVKKFVRLLHNCQYVVYLLVDLNRLSLWDVVTAMVKIRSGWDSRKKATFIFALARCTTKY